MAQAPRKPRAAKPSPSAPKPRYGKVRLPELETGATVFQVDPLVIKSHYEIDYLHSYAEDSPFFVGLSQGHLFGSQCTRCRYRYATPRAYCMQCANKTRWVELPREGRIHTWTTCYFGSQEFLKETPFNLVLVEFEGVDTLLLSRLVGASQEQLHVGMKIKAQFRRNAQFLPTDVYFVPAEPVTGPRTTAV